MAAFQEGQRVKLLPFEGNPTEFGTVIAEERDGFMYIVELDDPFRADDLGDDGIREVPADQMEAM